MFNRECPAFGNTLLGAVLLTKSNKMKQTLRERMENMLCRIVGRVEMLQKSINEYKEAGDFENAMKYDIKMRTFKLIEDDLRKELQS